MEVYCGIDLHSNNMLVGIKDAEGKVLFRRRLDNDLRQVLNVLEPYRDRLRAVAVESTFNWCLSETLEQLAPGETPGPPQYLILVSTFRQAAARGTVPFRVQRSAQHHAAEPVADDVADESERLRDVTHLGAVTTARNVVDGDIVDLLAGEREQHRDLHRRIEAVQSQLR